MKKLLLLLLLLPALAIGQQAEYESYDDCILDRLAGISSDIAAQAIIEACETKYLDSEEIAVTPEFQEKTEESLSPRIEETIATSPINEKNDPKTPSASLGIDESNESTKTLPVENIETVGIVTTENTVIPNNKLGESDFQILYSLKKQYLPDFPDKTIGELFDDYKHCEAKGWRVDRTKEDTVVDYFCDIKIGSRATVNSSRYVKGLPRCIRLDLNDIDDSLLMHSNWSALGEPIEMALLQSGSETSVLCFVFEENMLEVKVYLFENIDEREACEFEYFDSYWAGYEHESPTVSLFLKFNLGKDLSVDGKFSYCVSYEDCEGHNVDGNTFLQNEDKEPGFLSQEFLKGISKNKNPSKFYYNRKIESMSNKSHIFNALSSLQEQRALAFEVKNASCADSYLLIKE
jgi:hypothetical protein